MSEPVAGSRPEYVRIHGARLIEAHELVGRRVSWRGAAYAVWRVHAGTLLLELRPVPAGQVERRVEELMAPPPL